jgi:hypothetical protein
LHIFFRNAKKFEWLIVTRGRELHGLARLFYGKVNVIEIDVGRSRGIQYRGTGGADLDVT